MTNLAAELLFTRTKETKNTYRYEAPEDSSIQGSLYIRKSAIPDPPLVITVTLSTPTQAAPTKRLPRKPARCDAPKPIPDLH